MANTDLNQIRIFIKVAQLKSFTKAAQALAIEKSTVSTKINQLESSLGIRLLQRTTRSVSLTEAGAQYLDFCEQGLDTIQKGNEFVASLSQEPSGFLRVCVPQNMVEYIMDSVIVPFLKRYPKVRLEVIQSNEHGNIIEDQFDIAVRSTAEHIPDSSLIYRKIYHSEWMLAASPEHIKQYGVANTPLQLEQQPCVGLVNENNGSKKTETIDWQNQKIHLKYRYAGNNMISVIQAIKAGLGFGMVPKKMIRQALKDNSLLPISEDIRLNATSLYVVYPSKSGQPAKLKAFVDTLVDWGEAMQAESF